MSAIESISQTFQEYWGIFAFAVIALIYNYRGTIITGIQEILSD